MTTLEMISVLDSYLAPEQREQLVSRREALGPHGLEEAKNRGNALVEQVLVHVRDETPVDDPRVQELVRRWDELRVAFQPEGVAGEQVKAAVQRMWDEHNEELSQNTPWPAEELRALIAYMKRARAVGSDH